MRRSLVQLALLASAVAEPYACPVTSPAAADQNNPNTPQKPTLPDPMHFVGGQLKPFTGPTDEVTSPVYDAATGKRARPGALPRMSADDALDAVRAAASAWDKGQGAWPQMSLAKRIEAVERVLESRATLADVWQANS